MTPSRRGDFTGAAPVPGVFVAAPGTQKHQYDFVGNIRSTDILANASEQPNSADRKLTVSFNAVNEEMNHVEQVGGASGMLTEIKSVKSLSYTQQLRDYADYANENGLVFELWMPRGVEMSRTLRDEIDAGRIVPQWIPGT